MGGWTRNEKVGVATGIVAIIAIVVTVIVPEIRQFFRLDRSVSVTPPLPTKQEALPTKQESAKVYGVAVPNVDELRRRNGVIRLRTTESDETLSEIPPGTFGCADSIDFTHRRTPSELRLKPEGRSDWNLELQKLADGHSEFVSYVGDETLERVLKGLGEGEKLTIYTGSWKEAPNLVTLPVESILCKRLRIISLDRHSLRALDCEVAH